MHIYLFSGTHWDREWYQTFQGFRYRLVKMLDHLVDYFENDDSKSVFHMDGQVIVLEDYAEINPEGYERLLKLIQQGRVLIGPWYCMPDEYLISGESLIRNLLKGDELSRSVGAEPWKCGYICDIFGHMAQMPQILQGFGMNSAVLGRGTNEHSTPSLFSWDSPDGSSVNVFRLPDKDGYGSFAAHVCGQRVAGFWLQAEDEAFETKARNYIDHLKEVTNAPFIVLWDALDHEPFHEETQDYLRKLQDMYPEDVVVQTNLLDALNHISDPSALPHLHGELREPGKSLEGGYIQVLTHVLSSRQSLKARNDHCQSLLEKKLEPALLLLAENDFCPADGYRRTAWKHLLQNHAHDSICGCSIDQVHKDMLYRFDQVDSINDALMEEGTWFLSHGLKFAGGQTSYLTMLNTQLNEASGFVEVEVPFNQAYAKWHEPMGYEDIAAFRLYDDQGAEIPYAITGRKTNTVRRGLGGGPVPCDLYKLLIPVTRKGLGLFSYRIEESKLPVRFFGGFADRRGTMDNGLLRVEINADGTINLTDKKTGVCYQNLLGLNDSAEIGDGWKHCGPVMDQRMVRSRIGEVSILANTSTASRVRIVRELEIPKQMHTFMTSNERSEERCVLRIEFTLTIVKGMRELHVAAQFDNIASDHVLRVVMPTGIRGYRYEASQDFCFVERDCRIDEQTGSWREVMSEEAPMNGIVLKRAEDNTGLAFVSGGGLHECIAEENGDLSVTLIRSFSKTQGTAGEIGGQELFKHDYQWVLLPLDDSVTRTTLQNRQDSMMSQPEHFVTVEAMDQSLMQVEGDVCVSALKPAEDGSGDWILRLFNVEKHATTATVSSSVSFRKAAICTMLEHETAPLMWKDGKTTLDVAAGKIITVRFYKF